MQRKAEKKFIKPRINTFTSQDLLESLDTGQHGRTEEVGDEELQSKCPGRQPSLTLALLLQCKAPCTSSLNRLSCRDI